MGVMLNSSHISDYFFVLNLYSIFRHFVVLGLIFSSLCIGCYYGTLRITSRKNLAHNSVICGSAGPFDLPHIYTLQSLFYIMLCI